MNPNANANAAANAQVGATGSQSTGMSEWRRTANLATCVFVAKTSLLGE